jgi:hypothetical protein
MHVLANKKILQIIHEFLGANAHLSTTHSNAIKPCNVKNVSFSSMLASNIVIGRPYGPWVLACTSP